MKEFWKFIVSDLKQRRNIELYVTLLVIIVIFVADIVGVGSASVLFEITLAALAILIYDSLESRHRSQVIEDKLDEISATKLSASFFQEWTNDSFTRRLKTANEISLLAVTNFEFIDRNYDDLVQFVQRGGILRCILMETDGQAMKLAVRQNAGANRNLDYFVSASHQSFGRLKELSNTTTKPENVQIKTIDNIPFAVLTMIDQNHQDGVMFVTIMGFNQPFRARPSFTLNKDTDQKWFTFYHDSFEKLWSCDDAKIVSYQ